MSLPLNQIIQGDCCAVMRGFPKESVDMVMFSPPYWGLRDYGVEGQIGLEKHPNEWIARIVLVCGEVKRVLKKTGSLYLNVGDTYFGSGVHLPHHKTREGSLNYLNDFVEPKQKSWSKIKNKGWLQPKQLLGMPWRLAIALQENAWILRNCIIWNKPNHMPSSVKDRLTNAYEFIFHFVKARRYFYDLDAIRQPHRSTHKAGNKRKNREHRLMSRNPAQDCFNPLGKNPSDIFQSKKEPYLANNPHRMRQNADDYIALDSSKPMDLSHPKGKNPSDIILERGYKGGRIEVDGEWLNDTCPHCGRTMRRHFGVQSGKSRFIPCDAKGKNPSDFWSINTKPFPQAHFAVYPEAICEMPIKSSCPHAVCRECGKPKTRITKPTKEYAEKLGKAVHSHKEDQIRGMRYDRKASSAFETVGWSSCKCNAGFDAGIVLDPMCGAGTTLVVAQKLGRRWIGIDLKKEYVEMAKKRLMRECSQKLTKFCGSLKDARYIT